MRCVTLTCTHCGKPFERPEYRIKGRIAEAERSGKPLPRNQFCQLACRFEHQKIHARPKQNKTPRDLTKMLDWRSAGHDSLVSLKRKSSYQTRRRLSALNKDPRLLLQKFEKRIATRLLAGKPPAGIHWIDNRNEYQVMCGRHKMSKRCKTYEEAVAIREQMELEYLAELICEIERMNFA